MLLSCSYEIKKIDKITGQEDFDYGEPKKLNKKNNCKYFIKEIETKSFLFKKYRYRAKRKGEKVFCKDCKYFLEQGTAYLDY